MAHVIENIIQDTYDEDIQYVIWRDGLACHIDVFSFSLDFAPKMKPWEKEDCVALDRIALELVANKDMNSYPDISKAHELVQYLFHKCLTCEDRNYMEAFYCNSDFKGLQEDMKNFHLDDLFIFYKGDGFVQIVVHTDLKTKFRYFNAPSCIAL